MVESIDIHPSECADRNLVFSIANLEWLLHKMRKPSWHSRVSSQSFVDNCIQYRHVGKVLRLCGTITTNNIVNLVYEAGFHIRMVYELRKEPRKSKRSCISAS
eukprot:TRINITY_DN20000_c0_g1_i1.p2 TRINITY_DN20000_c0_g1~~TRINITY_DN20000_c0_g1_i1.p2  ORF type:complete len:103 (-),score=11.39 TRINITY_DN20000_c0_g1_i1:98-406(-)